MIIDCDTCAVRGPACQDCVITCLLGPPSWLDGEGLPGEEVAALAVLAGSGLVPPLRLVPPWEPDSSPRRGGVGQEPDVLVWSTAGVR
ncbi:unannotated protein [freshwater metagenome]|uniref:Unannotated protein n=1 Tax=freshwater metagenome TaxID=449393 RepID=A0A6J7BSP4_9ZZZZ|nr:hypothetical protein [Actinomycetota bacterium]